MVGLAATLALTASSVALAGDKKGARGGQGHGDGARECGVDAADKTLERAVKLYDKKDFFSASIELKKVLDGESGDDAKNKQRGEFFMGKTLYQMGYYAGSLAYFDKIVQAGDNHTYHGAALSGSPRYRACCPRRRASREDRYLRCARSTIRRSRR